MSYININLVHEKGYNLKEVNVMQLLKQNRSEDMERFLVMYFNDDILEKFDREGIIDKVKKKKKADSDFSIMRLSKKGDNLLEDFQTPEILEEDLTIYSWLSNIYQKTDREIGNKRKTKMWIACFRANSQISRNKLAFLCQHFLDDESQMEYSKKLEFLFFKPSNLFTTKFDLDQSRLYQHYVKYEDFFLNKFAEIE